MATTSIWLFENSRFSNLSLPKQKILPFSHTLLSLKMSVYPLYTIQRNYITFNKRFLKALKKNFFQLKIQLDFRKTRFSELGKNLAQLGQKSQLGRFSVRHRLVRLKFAAFFSLLLGEDGLCI